MCNGDKTSVPAETTDNIDYLIQVPYPYRLFLANRNVDVKSDIGLPSALLRLRGFGPRVTTSSSVTGDTDQLCRSFWHKNVDSDHAFVRARLLVLSL